MSNIAFIVPDISRYAGTERVNVNIANEFVKKNAVEIITQNKENDEIFFSLDTRITICDLDVDGKIPALFNNCGKFRTLLKLIITYYLLKKQIRNNLYTHILGMSGFLNWMLAKIGNDKGKVILCEHRDYKYIPWYFRIFQRIYYNKSDSIVVLSKSQKRQFPTKIKNVAIIPNYGQFTFKKNQLNHSRISYIGRLDREKRVDILINSFLMIADNFPDYHLIIAGDGNACEELKTLGNHPQIEFLGLVASVEPLWEQSDLAVLPSASEAFPMTILEAMCKGVPFIGFDVPGVRDIIRHDYTGILLKEQTVFALSDAISTLLQNKALLNRYSQGCFEVIENYTKESVMKQWDNLLF